tara:strand:+ start:4017 stop:5825 length:1809 start_codon:yes stop_codon:yes gene_type:complete
MATEYATLIFKADTKEIGQAYNQLQKLNKQGKITDATLQSFEKSMKGAGKGAKGVTKGIGGLGRGAGQAGVQVQQLVGQIQGGQNPMLAFSQQAADIGIVLGAPMAGAIAGLAFSLGMVLLPALMDSMRGLDELAEAVDEMGKSLKNDFPELYAARMVELADKEDQARESVEKHTKKIAELTAQRNKGLTLQIQGIDLAGSEAEQRKILQDLIDKEIVTRGKQVVALQEAQFAQKQLSGQQSQAEKDAEKQSESIMQIVLDLEMQTQKLTKSTVAWAVYEAQLAGASQEVVNWVKATTEFNLAFEKATDAVDKKTKSADRYLERLEKQARSMNRTKAEAMLLESASLALTDVQKQRVAVLIQEIELEDKKAKKLKEAAAASKELEQLGLLKVESDEIDTLKRKSERLEEFRALDLISEAKYQEAKSELDKKQKEFAIKSAGDALAALGEHNKTAFKLAKAYQIGQAVMNTASGVTKALASLPPPINFIVAAAVAASGLAQIQTIRSTQYSGRALGGQVRGGESYLVGERGPEVLTMGSGGNITPNDKIQPAQAKGQAQSININFQITANDARGFDELLQERRGMIMGMISQSMNNQGRRSLV